MAVVRHTGHRPGFARAVDQSIEVGAHEAGERALRYVAGKGHGLLRLVDRQDGAHQALLVRGIGAQRQREQ